MRQGAVENALDDGVRHFAVGGHQSDGSEFNVQTSTCLFGATQQRSGTLVVVAPRSRGLKQLTADEHAPYLLRAGANLVELGVAQQPTGSIVVDIPVAAQ